MQETMASPLISPTVSRSHARRRQIISAYLMILGALLIVGLFTLYPYAYALWASLQNLSPILPPSFAGLDNYVGIITSEYFVDAVRNTLVFTIASVPLILLLGIGVASLFTQRFVGDVVLKALILLPWAIPAAISGVIWKSMFNDTWGPANAVPYVLGLIPKYINWLTTAPLAMGVTIFAQVWTQFPMATVLILASMQAIPQELYEAAAIDGAGIWKRFTTVTLPSSKPMIVIVALYEVLIGLTSFDLIYGLTGGGPGTATTVISYFGWSETFKMLSFGRGAALSVIVALGSLLLIFAILRLLPKNAFLEERA